MTIATHRKESVISASAISAPAISASAISAPAISASAISASVNPVADVDELLSHQENLERAYQYFNESSSFLADSYHALQNKIRLLSEELDGRNKERDQELKERQSIEHKLSALLDFLPGGVIVLDASGSIVESNPAARELLDTKLEGRVWRHVIAESFAPKNDDGFEVSTRKGRRVSVATSSLGEEGQILLLTDQTDTRILQDNLSRNERLSAMGKMVSALAHQIRTPLSAALLYAGHLCHSELNDDQKEQFSNKLLGRLEHMEMQVRDMMLFVKNELPLNDIASVSDLERGLKAAAEVVLCHPKVQCDWQNYAATNRIKCNREALVSALMNLVNNAAQSSQNELHISVQFNVIRNENSAVGAPIEEQLQIIISDDGEGMTAEQLQRIQVPFSTTKSQGTGLGLSVVRSIASAHGGSFQLRSHKGLGTTAEIRLPLCL
ncbi:MAG: two-component system sensor histidine kinase FlrB [Flavobacteriales bacterium]